LLRLLERNVKVKDEDSSVRGLRGRRPIERRNRKAFEESRCLNLFVAQKAKYYCEQPDKAKASGRDPEKVPSRSRARTDGS